jgi:peroxiredoxin
VGISYDSVDVLARFARKHKITFPLLADAGSKTIRAYGLLNKEVKGGRLAGIPYPGTVLVGKDGVIRAKLFLKGYAERHSTEKLIQTARSIK